MEYGKATNKNALSMSRQMVPKLSWLTFGIFAAGILRKDDSHLSPVVSLLPLVMPGDRYVVAVVLCSNCKVPYKSGINYCTV